MWQRAAGRRSSRQAFPPHNLPWTPSRAPSSPLRGIGRPAGPAPWWGAPASSPACDAARAVPSRTRCPPTCTLLPSPPLFLFRKEGQVNIAPVEGEETKTGMQKVSVADAAGTLLLRDAMGFSRGAAGPPVAHPANLACSTSTSTPPLHRSISEPEPPRSRPPARRAVSEGGMEGGSRRGGARRRDPDPPFPLSKHPSTHRRARQGTWRRHREWVCLWGGSACAPPATCSLTCPLAAESAACLAVAQSPVPPPPPPPPPPKHTHTPSDGRPLGLWKEGRRGPWRQRRAGVKRPSRAAGGYMAGCRRDACNPRLLRLHATVDLS